MKRLQAFNKATIVLAAAIAGAFSPLFSEAFKPTLGAGVAGAFIFAAVLFILSLLQILVDSVTSRSRWLRRILLGHSYIEGYWVDCSRAPNNEIVGAACIYIFYHDDRLEISGTTLKADDGMYACWDVKFATLEHHTLAYAFESHTNRAESPVELGYAELKFSHGNSDPTSYSGFFFDTTNKVMITLEGSRVVDASSIQRLEQPDERRRFLAEALAKQVTLPNAAKRLLQTTGNA